MSFYNYSGQKFRLLLVLALVGVLGIGMISFGIERGDPRLIKVGIMNWIIVFGGWAFMRYSDE